MGTSVDYLPNPYPLKSTLTLVVAADRVRNKCDLPFASDQSSIVVRLKRNGSLQKLVPRGGFE